MQQSQQKTSRKNSLKMQGAICICHNVHKDKAQICLVEEHLAAIQEFRGKRSDVHLQDLMDTDFSLIPRPTVI